MPHFAVHFSNSINCAPLVADLFLFCYERDFMLSLSGNNQTDIILAIVGDDALIS